MQRRHVTFLLTLLLTAPATSTLAHHGMHGETPRTWLDGLVSGLLHPVIGLDHLASLLLFGALAGSFARSRWLPAGFVASSLAGCIAHLSRAELPYAEHGLALSLVALGAWTLALRAQATRALITAAGVAGLLHGYAYGEAMVGSEPTPIGAYLLGLALAQLGTVTLAARLSRYGDVNGARARWRVQRVVGALAVLSVALGAFALAS